MSLQHTTNVYIESGDIEMNEPNKGTKGKISLKKGVLINESNQYSVSQNKNWRTNTGFF
jgi:hypothetical protein